MPKGYGFSPNNFAFPRVDYNGFTLFFGTINHHYSKQEVTQCFNYDGLASFEENGRTFIENPLSNLRAEIVFDLTLTSDYVKYPMYIKSDYFDYKQGRRKVEEHKRFCKMIISRIKWKKQGYYIENGKDVLIPKMTLIKQVTR